MIYIFIIDGRMRNTTRSGAFKEVTKKIAGILMVGGK
jgi:hypothetical protein